MTRCGSGKRIFTNNQETNFHDYLNYKKGKEMIKHRNSVGIDRRAKLSGLNYHDFMTLVRAFSKHSNIQTWDIANYSSMQQKTHALIYYEKINSHILSCDSCRANPEIHQLMNCENIKNIMYAYQNHYNNIYGSIYQKKIDFSQWCEPCNFYFSVKQPMPEQKPIVKESNCQCPSYSFPRTSIGRKAIFCSLCNQFIDLCLCAHRWGRTEVVQRVNRKTNLDPDLTRNKKALFI